MIYSTGPFVSEILTTMKECVSNKKICAITTLHAYEQREILLKTFMRSWKTFWTEYNTSNTLFKSGTSEDKNKPYTLQLTPQSNTTPIRVSLEFTLKSDTSFDVRPIICVASSELQKKYLDDVNKLLYNISIDFIKYYDEELFLEHWFDTLHKNNLSGLSGEEAVFMHKIYFNAIKYFPDFAKITLKEQIDLLQTGCLKGHDVRYSKRDIHVYAMYTYEALEAANVTNSFIATNPFSRRTILYRKIQQYRREAISFGRYIYEITGKQFRTSIYNFDLWKLLCCPSSPTYGEVL